MPKCSARRVAWVPLPAPGAPINSRRMGLLGSGDRVRGRSGHRILSTPLRWRRDRGVRAQPAGQRWRVESFERMWAEPSAGRSRRFDRRVPALRLDRRRPDLPEWFAGERRGRGLDLDRRPQRQPVGLVGRPRPRRPRRRHRQPPRLGARRRRVRRPARGRRRPSRRSTCCGATGFAPRRPVGVVNFDRRGGRAVRHRLRRLAPAHRRARRRPGARRCATTTARRWPRRCRAPVATRRTSAATTRRCAGSAPSSSCTSSRAAASIDLGAPSASAARIWPHGRWRLDLPGEANHAGTTRAGRPRTTPCSAWPARCSPRAARPPDARRAGDDRQGARRARRHRTRSPSLGAPPGSTRAAPTSRPCAPSSPSVAPRAAGDGLRHRGVVDPEPSTSTGRAARRLARLLGGAAGPGDRRGPRRRHPRRRRASERDAVRAQPDRGLALPRRVRVERDDCLAGVDALADRARPTSRSGPAGA